MNTLKNFSKGLIKENPVLVLVLGTCPTLATSTSVSSALGMGAAATVVLLCSNIVISALRKIIPDKVRIPCYIVLIAGFVRLFPCEKSSLNLFTHTSTSAILSPLFFS